MRRHAFLFGLALVLSHGSLSQGAYAQQAKRLADLALENRLPAIFGFRGFADMGGLISYGSSQEGMLRRASSYADKILRGTSPSDLPIEQPTRFELVVNLKTAKRLGLEVPAMLLATADEVIE
jgi:putative ABC transport system substrate-binding protein